MVDFMISSLCMPILIICAVLTNHNYKSLLDHMSHGKDWDLNRKIVGLNLLLLCLTIYRREFLRIKLGALATMVYTQSLDEEFVIFSGYQYYWKY